MHKSTGFAILRFLMEVGPRYVFAKALRRISSYLGKWQAALRGTELSDDALRRSLRSEFSDPALLLASFLEGWPRRFPISSLKKEEAIQALHRLNPRAVTRMIRAADAICEHTFDLLGSGPTNLGWPLDWHADFKTGHRWDPKQYYAEIRPAPYPGGYDLKVPWELSRCQHFAWLGQAYWLTGDQKFAREFRAEVEDWIRQNKPEYGVNWACSMDIAIRAVNWLWGYAFFQSSPVLDDDFRWKFYKSLVCHGRHIRANLERTATFTGNHYLSDIVGLVYLGMLLPELKEAQDWRDFGLRELEQEVRRQVYADGVNFEASTSYHRLVTELFLSATLLAEHNGHRFSDVYMQRLEGMLEFIFQITKPDGSAPLIGDQDNGRLHRLKVWDNPDAEWKDFRGLLAIGSLLFDRPEWGRAAGDQWEEAIWFYGLQAYEAFQSYSQRDELPPRSKGFQDSGIYVLRAEDIYVAVDLGPVGQNGKGGHAHNDSLSFELFSDGQTWIQDPGTYLYTADYEARNQFRSTAFHNTLTVLGYEQNGFDTLTLFSLNKQSVSELRSWRVEGESDTLLTAELRRLKPPHLNHRRSFHLCGKNRSLLITDLLRSPVSTSELLFHFAADLEPERVETPYPGVKIINADRKVCWLFSLSSSDVSFNLSRGWISEGYGQRVPGWVLSIALATSWEHKTVILLPGQGDIAQRVEAMMNDEAHDH